MGRLAPKESQVVTKTAKKPATKKTAKKDKPTLFTAIITHIRPHLDEIFAIWMLLKFGEKLFPGISKAKIVFAGAGGEDLEGLSGDDYLSAGVVLVGVGGGQFDEHPGVKTFGKDDECAATLVAKALGLDSNPALTVILRFVKNADCNAACHPFDLFSMVKIMYQVHPDQSGQIMNWANVAIEAKYQEQLQFVEAQTKLGSGGTQIDTVTGHHGKTLTIMSAQTGSEAFSKACRANGADVVIQQQPSGNVQVYTANKANLCMDDTARMLRLEEQKAKGNIPTANWNDLSREGKVAGAEEWYYHLAGRMLLNGSLSCPDVPPTNLSLDKVRELVQIGVCPTAFEPTRCEACLAGKCTSTRVNPCPWYDYGLNRCQAIRRKNK